MAGTPTPYKRTWPNFLQPFGLPVCRYCTTLWNRTKERPVIHADSAMRLGPSVKNKLQVAFSQSEGCHAKDTSATNMTIPPWIMLIRDSRNPRYINGTIQK